MKEPTYIVALTPDQPNKVNELFKFGIGMPNEILEQPGSFRYAGWNMETLSQARIVDGKFIELKNGDRKTLRLYEDGSFIVTGAINNNFLSWGKRDSDDGLLIHALAIIEFTTAFVYLYKLLIPTLDKMPDSLSFHIEITNGKIDEKFIQLIPYEVNTFGFTFQDDKGSLSTENPEYTGKIKIDDILNDPDKASFDIIRRLFLFFSIAENKIPYTVEKDGVRRIDVAKIKAIK